MSFLFWSPFWFYQSSMSMPLKESRLIYQWNILIFTLADWTCRLAAKLRASQFEYACWATNDVCFISLSWLKDKHLAACKRIKLITSTVPKWIPPIILYSLSWSCSHLVIKNYTTMIYVWSNISVVRFTFLNNLRLCTNLFIVIYHPLVTLSHL